MAKGKTLNPADAHRKAQRARELKKNKEKRTKARETATLKKDTSGVEAEIHELENLGEAKLDQKQKARLSELRAEVEQIRKTKQEYVKAHPEQAHLVRGLEGSRRRQEPILSGSAAAPAIRSIFGKNGLPVRPERSLYYDPVMNPYGMPPPGMPYAERPLLPHEIEEDRLQNQVELQHDGAGVDAEMSDASTDSDSGSDDEEITMPAGPPPDGDNKNECDSDSEDSDDIPMPPGPPPHRSAPPLPQGPPPMTSFAPHGNTFPPFPAISSYTHMPPNLPPPPGVPMGFQPGYTLPFAQNSMTYPHQASAAGQILHPLRDRQHIEAVRVVQDPLSNVPHVTFQAHQAQQHQHSMNPSPSAHLGLHSLASLPPKPSSASLPGTSATIFAEPELRDLKKEATAFVPASMRRAKKGPSNSSSSTGLHINAAPDEKDDGEASAEPRKDLMSVLGSQLGGGNKPPVPKTESGQGKDDYDKFLAEVGSFL